LHGQVVGENARERADQIKDQFILQPLGTTSGIEPSTTGEHIDHHVKVPDDPEKRTSRR
jgi:hypothetical protein